jgi:hypothetical protein
VSLGVPFPGNPPWLGQTYLYLVLLVCILSPTDFLRFVFDLFAMGSDTLAPASLHHLMLAVNNGEPMFGSFKIPGSRAGTTGSAGGTSGHQRGPFTFADFTALCRRQAGLLFPVFHMQDLLREATLGRAAWSSIMDNAALLEV